MNGKRIIIAAVSHLGLIAILAVDRLLHTHLCSVLLLTLISALALAELYPLFRRMGLDPRAEYGVACLVVLLLARGLLGYLGLDPAEVKAIVLFLFAAAVVLPPWVVLVRQQGLRAEGREPLTGVAGTLFGLLLIWYTLSFLLELRLVDVSSGEAVVGWELVLILLLAVKVGDSTAYLVGKSIGVRPLTRISPRKTWEGAAGSVAGSVAVAAAGAIILGYPLWKMLLFGVIVSIAGQLGDLLESLLKRRAGVKDSGSFFRESGGFLDMVDSLLIAAPVGYLYVRFVIL